MAKRKSAEVTEAAPVESAEPAALVAVRRELAALELDLAGLAIRDDEGYAQAGRVLTRIKTYQRSVHDVLDEIVEAAHEAHNVAVAKRKALLTPSEVAEVRVKGLLAEYSVRIEAARRAAEAQLAAEAQKVAEAEALARATQLEAAGKPEAAEAVLAAAVEAPAPVVSLPRVAPAAEGISTRQVWRYEVARADLVPREFCSPDPAKLAAYVRAFPGRHIPGVRVWQATEIAARAAGR